MRRPHLTYANVMSTLGVFLALGGTSYAVARNSIGERELKDSAITSRKVRDGALQARDLAADAKVSGPRGPRGMQGPGGATGPPGPQGPAAATVPENWKPFPLAAGWASIGGEWDTAKYRKDHDGVVHLRGVVTFGAGAPASTSVIGTLPPGYRPNENMIFAVSNGEPQVGGRVKVATTGQLTWFGGNTGEVDYTSLATVAFPTD